MYACFCYLQSYILTVYAPIMISLQQQSFDSLVYSFITLRQKGVLYLTGKHQKLTFLNIFIFLSFMSPNETLNFFFQAINFKSLINQNIKDLQLIYMRASLVKISKYFCSKTNRTVNLVFEQQKKSVNLILSNIKKRNTMSLGTIKQIKSSLDEVQKKILEKKVKILILQGEGTVFSSGHDLKQLGSSPNPKEIFDLCSQVMLKIRNFPVPTLCVVNGIAAAAGFQLALACDLIVASQKSTFSTPGVKWGLFCSTPAVQLIRSINSQKKAMQMLLFGQSISAKQAHQYGLVNKVVPEDKLKQTVDDFVKKVNSLSSQVIQHGKSVLRAQRVQNIQQAYCTAGQGMRTNIAQKQDCSQGLKAFSQKRHPHYKN